MAKARKSYYDILDRFEYSSSSPTGIVYKIDNKAMNRGKKFAGDIAGYLWKGKYFVVKVGRKSYFVHRIIYMLFNGDIDSDVVVDHIDRDTLNNKIDNLRAVDYTLNSRNASKQVSNKSGVTGVILKLAKGVPKHWVAYWNYDKYKQKTKNFNILKYGYDAAFQMAVDCRKKALEDMISSGMGYSLTHGD